MNTKPAEKDMRRVAIILGTGGADQMLLEILRPLLGKDRRVDLHGVFVVEDELHRAAALPFAKELCQLTLSVQEFHSTRLEHAVTSRTRSAREAIARLALRTGVPHTFSDVRGSLIGMLQETAQLADITVFEPLKPFARTTILQTVQTSRQKQRITVVVDDLVTGAMVLRAAKSLAEGNVQRISILLFNATRDRREKLQGMINELALKVPVHIQLLAEPGISQLIKAAREQGTTMLVIGTSEDLLQPGSLRLLREQLRCPVCLVRQWDDNTVENENPETPA